MKNMFKLDEATKAEFIKRGLRPSEIPCIETFTEGALIKGMLNGMLLNTLAIAMAATTTYVIVKISSNTKHKKNSK